MQCLTQRTEPRLVGRVLCPEETTEEHQEDIHICLNFQDSGLRGKRRALVEKPCTILLVLQVELFQESLAELHRFLNMFFVVLPVGR